LDTLKNASGYFRNVMTAFEPRGYFHTKFVSEIYSVRWDIIYITASVLIFWFSRSYLQFGILLSDFEIQADHLLFLFLALILILPSYRLLSSTKRLLDALSVVFSQTTASAKKGHIIRNFTISVLFFLVFANYFLIINLLALPDIFNWFSLIFGILPLFFFWSAVRVSSTWFMLSGRKSIFVHYPSAKTSPNDLVLVAQKPTKQPKKHH
ncbi:MAG: hypothetical protein ABID61_04810, partial [Candidatus Micrarchaeota archaeon]